MPPSEPHTPARSHIPDLRHARRAGHAPMRDCLLAGDAFFSDELSRHWGALAPQSRVPYARALAECEVGAALKPLGSRWAVLHSVPTATGGSVPHVVVGPAGVFTIRSEPADGGRVSVTDRIVAVDGRVIDAVRHAERSARHVRRILGGLSMWGDGQVHAVVAVAGAGKLRTRSAPTWGSVRRAPDLAAWLASRPTVLSGDRLAALTEAVASPDTWGIPVAVLHEQDPAPRFWRLHDRVIAEVPVAEWPVDRSGAAPVPPRRTLFTRLVSGLFPRDA